MPSPPLQSTRLENIRLGPDGAHLHLDGHPVHLRPDQEAAPLAALQSFYEGARQEVAAAESGTTRPGLFARLRSWLGRMFSEPAPTAGAPPVPPLLAPPPPVPTARPAPEAALGGPQLQAVYSDPQGVHLQWHLPSGKRSGATLDRRYPPDSELGKRLQDCYGHLAQMGYQIVGVNLQPIGASAPTKEAPIPTAEKSPSAASANLRAAGEAEIKKPGEGKSPTWVVRLLPETPDQPGRALTAPFVTAENIQPLAGPDRLIRALRTATDPKNPDGDALTCLRCSFGKTGLKVVAVGLGQTSAGEPARWEDVAPWLERQPEPAEEKKPRATPVPRVSAPDLELNI